MPYPTNIHFCSDFAEVWRHYRSVYNRIDVNGPSSYINHASSLLLVTLITNPRDPNRSWIVGNMYELGSINKMEQWLLDNRTCIPRVVKATFWLACDVLYGHASGHHFTETFYRYLETDYLAELRKFVIDEKHSIFLQNFMLEYAGISFGSNERVRKISYLVFAMHREFHILHPIFFPYWINIRDMGQKIDFKSRFQNPVSNPSIDDISEVAIQASVSYELDADFFERLKSEAKLLKSGMSVLDYLFWMGQYHFEDNYPCYTELVIWFRDHGFEFEGDDPLGLRHLISEWRPESSYSINLP